MKKMVENSGTYTRYILCFLPHVVNNNSTSNDSTIVNFYSELSNTSVHNRGLGFSGLFFQT